MDDHPICVVDATTLVDHIQEIKSLIYQGRMRLVVPQRTSTPLEQKHAKLTEEANKKPSRKPESQRPRSSGRPAKVENPAKVEQPAMDINPLVAGEFLARFRSDENQRCVEFQKDSEQYSPWRLQELEEESKKANENKPTSFAQAARKASMEKFSSSTGTANGPAKPRLVARSAGVDGSPWKTSKKALSLPIGDIPKESRPVLSCLLWRIHEKGATLWDTNRTYFLCGNGKTNALAKKLGIVTKSMKELRELCNKQGLTKKTRETFGDLEEHFSMPEVVQATPLHDTGKESIATSTSPTVEPPTKDGVDGGTPKHDKGPQPTVFSREVTESSSSADSSKFAKHSAGLEQRHDQEASKPAEDIDQLKDNNLGDRPPAVPSENGNHEPPGLSSASAADEIRQDTIAKSDRAVVQPPQPVFNTLAIEKEHSIAEWVRGLMDAASNSELSGRDTPLSGPSASMEATAAPIEPAKPFKPLTYRQAVTGKAEDVVKIQALPPKEILSSPRVSPARESSPPKVEDPLDSEEEMIVFNPKAKRLSAQKAQQAQQAQQTPPPVQAPQVQQAQRPQTPKSSPNHGHTRNASGSRTHIRGGFQRQSRPGPPPVVIDPDSFGRGLVTKAQPPVARTFSPYGVHGRVPNERRGNHRSPNARPPAHITPPKVNGAAMPNGSANAIPQPAAEQSLHAARAIASVGSAPAVQAPAMTTPSSVLKPSLIVNGSSAGPSLPGSSPVVNGFVVQNSPGVPVRAERPRYSPRGSPRRTPIVPEPEVGYILKSGQPREVTRGRGKLWVP